MIKEQSATEIGMLVKRHDEIAMIKSDWMKYNECISQWSIVKHGQGETYWKRKRGKKNMRRKMR